MSYEKNLSSLDKNEQLLFGLQKHLTIAQTTSNPKAKRLESLANIAEVLEFVIHHLNGNTAEDAMLYRFFNHLLVTVKTAELHIHQKPITFLDEIGFLSTLLKITNTK
jgi:hypothetical protein